MVVRVGGERSSGTATSSPCGDDERLAGDERPLAVSTE